jgi:hypothetical protein
MFSPVGRDSLKSTPSPWPQTPPKPAFLDSRVAESLAGLSGAALGHVAALPACHLLTSGLLSPHPEGAARDKGGGARRETRGQWGPWGQRQGG